MAFKRIYLRISSTAYPLQHILWSLENHRLEQLLLLQILLLLLLLLHLLMHLMLLLLLLLSMMLHALGDGVNPVLSALIRTCHLRNPKPSPSYTVACILCKLANFTWGRAVPA